MSDVRKLPMADLLCGVGTEGEQLEYALELARRIGIMEEYCESHLEFFTCDEEYETAELISRMREAEESYCAMKGEQNAKPGR